MSQVVEQLLQGLCLNGELEVIGSYPEYLKGKLKYPNDIDLQEYVKVKDAQSAYQMMRGLLMRLRNPIRDPIQEEPEVYVVDIKAGRAVTGNPRKWTYWEFVGVPQPQIFHQKALVKLDLVLVDEHHLFKEISVNYYFEIEQETHENPTNFYTFTPREVRDSIILDIQKLLHEGNYFKAMKRRYTLAKMNKADQRTLGLYVGVMNSPLGYLYQQASRLAMIMSLIENKAKWKMPTKALLIFNIQHVVAQVATVSQIPIPTQVLPRSTLVALHKFCKVLRDHLLDSILAGFQAGLDQGLGPQSRARALARRARPP